MIINRNLLSIFKGLNKSILLLGPRQTGKSTLVRQLKPSLEINFADQEVFIQHLSDPSLIKKQLGRHKKILIDEVQRIPSVLNTVQALIDKEKSLQFFLTGSSARKLRRGQANLLPGRVLSYELGPLTHLELGDQFEISRSLEFGLLPGIYLSESPTIAQKTLKTYAQTYLKEEIQAEALTRNLEGFSRFFQVAISRSGDHIDFSKFASLAMIERTSAKRYFEILIDTLIVYPIEAFTKSKKRRLIQHPKYYLFDVGVLNGALDNFKISPDRIGSLFEHLFLQLVLSMAKSKDQSLRVSTYRTNAGAEVDFIIETKDKIFAVEVKATKNIGKSDLTGLKSFGEFIKKEHQPLIVYLGENELEMDGIPIMSLTSALKYF